MLARLFNASMSTPMSLNPYTPPVAALADLTPLSPQDTYRETPPFFAVSLVKLVVLSFFTLGFYELYWFYKNWHLIKARERSDVVPILRAFFGVLFCYACFSRIRDHGEKLGVAPPLPAGAYTVGWVITTITWKLPQPYWLIAFLSIVFVVPVQAYVNRINKTVVPDHDPNAKFSAWNWVAIVVGGIIFILAMIGMFVPEQ